MKGRQANRGGGAQRTTAEDRDGASGSAPEADPKVRAKPINGRLFRILKEWARPIRQSDGNEAQGQRNNNEVCPSLDSKELGIKARPNPREGYHNEVQMLPGVPSV